MNRTQRKVKRICHQAFSHAKREKRQALYARNEAGWSFGDKSEALKAALKNEKALKVWHRKMVQDYAGNYSSKEEKTA